MGGRSDGRVSAYLTTSPEASAPTFASLAGEGPVHQPSAGSSSWTPAPSAPTQYPVPDPAPNPAGSQSHAYASVPGDDASWTDTDTSSDDGEDIFDEGDILGLDPQAADEQVYWQ